MDLLFSNKKMKTWAVGKTLITISTALSCDSPSSDACQRCKMVQAIMGEGSFGGSPETSQEYVSKIPIPGGDFRVSTSTAFSDQCKSWKFNKELSHNFQNDYLGKLLGINYLKVDYYIQEPPQLPLFSI